MADVVDITHLLDKEEGSAFDQESLLFQNFEQDGGIFTYDEATNRDMKEMLDVDGKARTLEQVLSLPIRAAPYAVTKAESGTEAFQYVDHCLTELANNGGMTTPLNLVIAQMTGAFVYRKAYFEKVFTRKVDLDNYVGYSKLAWRPQITCATVRDKKTAAFKGFRQMPIRYEDTEEIFIPAQRAFVYIHGTHRDPLEGTSDLTIARWCYVTKQKIRFLWYQFLEGQSLPKTLVKARTKSEAQQAAKDLIKLRSGGVVGVTDAITTDVLESSGRGASQFKEALQWLDAEASGSVLAGFTDLGAAAVTGTGSFALSKDQTDFFLMSHQAKAKEMQDFINQFLVADLVRYNFGPKEKSPVFEFNPIREDDAAAAIGLLQATAQSPNQILPREFMDELIERVASFLELNVQVVRDGLQRAAKEAEEQAKSGPQGGNPFAPKVAGVSGAVGAAANAVVRRNERVLEEAFS